MKNSRRVLLAFLIFVCSFFVACSTNFNHQREKILDSFSAEEKIMLEEFFYELLVEEKGVFVLFGSKPMILTQVSSYEFDDPSSTLLTTINDFAWDKVKEKFRVENYLMVRKPTSDSKIYDLIFANRTNVILALQENHQVFKDIIGHDFSPLEKAFELENPDSSFWNQVFKSHVLTGIILGYGQANSFFFDWWTSGFENDNHKIASYCKIAPFEISKEDEILEGKSVSFENFPLPSFRSLSTDTTLEKYARERARIKKAYIGKDPLAVTLKKLADQN